MKNTKFFLLDLIIIHIREFFLLFFPKSCVSCDTPLSKHESILCTKCLYDMPRTNYHEKDDNPIIKLFWGISDITYATSYFNFEKGSNYRNIIHKLKYKNQPEIGYELGKFFGVDLVDSVFNEIDVIIPVPLHPTKLFIRGYNQSESIAAGMSQTLDKTLDTSTLKRIKFTDTQTKKSLEERRQNVESVFKISKNHNLENKHILLIDDVVTTGSTLISCAEELLQIPNVKVSVATLGFAAH